MIKLELYKHLILVSKINFVRLSWTTRHTSFIEKEKLWIFLYLFIEAINKGNGSTTTSRWWRGGEIIEDFAH